MVMKGEGVFAIGKRKTSVARVYMRPGDGKVLINRKPVEEYFGRATLRMILRQPLDLVEAADRYDVLVNVNGGGKSGQAGAVLHGLSRAWLKINSEDRSMLKKEGFLRRDDRRVERKKYGRHKARKRPQFSKR